MPKVNLCGIYEATGDSTTIAVASSASVQKPPNLPITANFGIARSTEISLSRRQKVTISKDILANNELYLLVCLLYSVIILEREIRAQSCAFYSVANQISGFAKTLLVWSLSASARRRDTTGTKVRRNSWENWTINSTHSWGRQDRLSQGYIDQRTCFPLSESVLITDLIIAPSIALRVAYSTLYLIQTRLGKA